jgi:hypothetical protein
MRILPIGSYVYPLWDQGVWAPGKVPLHAQHVGYWDDTLQAVNVVYCFEGEKTCTIHDWNISESLVYVPMLPTFTPGNYLIMLLPMRRRRGAMLYGFLMSELDLVTY